MFTKYIRPKTTNLHIHESVTKVYLININEKITIPDHVTHLYITYSIFPALSSGSRLEHLVVNHCTLLNADMIPRCVNTLILNDVTHYEGTLPDIKILQLEEHFHEIPDSVIWLRLIKINNEHGYSKCAKYFSAKSCNVIHMEFGCAEKIELINMTGCHIKFPKSIKHIIAYNVTEYFDLHKLKNIEYVKFSNNIKFIMPSHYDHIKFETFPMWTHTVSQYCPPPFSVSFFIKFDYFIMII